MVGRIVYLYFVYLVTFNVAQETNTTTASSNSSVSVLPTVSSSASSSASSSGTSIASTKKIQSGQFATLSPSQVKIKYKSENYKSRYSG